MKTKNKVLVLDIETAPMVAYVWNRHDVNIALNQIKEDWSVMAWAAKWLDEPKMFYADQRSVKHVRDDRRMLVDLWSLLDEADIIITQNGTHFDGPRLNARFILHGMMPPSPYRHLDTYKIARRVADFTSNKLEYLTDKLCTKYKKLSHSEFPGMELWKECLAGNVKAWNAMKKYNIHDVLSTEELYHKIKAWAPESFAKVYASPNSLMCKVCGKAELIKQGSRLANKYRYQRYQCQNCATWQTGEKIKCLKQR